MPFKAYHTDKDNADLMSELQLVEAAMVVLLALDAVDNNDAATRLFQGLVCLSNPKYDLYKQTFDPSIADRRTATPQQLAFNSLMDCIPRYFDGKMTVLDIAERHQLPFRAVYDYVKQWQEKGLVEMVHP